MVNKNLLNVCYKYFNQFINAEVLVSELEKIRNKEIDEIIAGIRKRMEENPNKEDEFSRKRKAKIKDLIGKLSDGPKDGEIGEVLAKRVESLKKEYEREIDSIDRWFAITSFINENEYFNKNFDNLSKYELLEFIAQNICAPFPPQLKQDEFEEIVKAGIEKDEREWLWRLAFNYEKSDLDLKSIVDYYIKVKDAYYLSELISAVGDKLDIEYIVDQVKDKELINDLLDKKDIIGRYFTDEQFERLASK